MSGNLAPLTLPPRWLGAIAVGAALIAAGATSLVARAESPEVLILVLAVVAALGLGLLASRYPVCLVMAIWLFESIVSWRPVEQIQLFGFNRLLFYAVTGGAFVAAILFMVVLRGRRLRLSWVDLALGLYVLAFAAAALRAHDRNASFSALTYLLATISVLYTTRLVVCGPAQLRQVLGFLLLLFCAEALLGAGQFLSGRGVLYVTAETGGPLLRRASGTLGNGLGWYLDMGFILAFSLWYFGRREPAGPRQLITVAIIGAGLLAANTRGAWLDGALAVLVAVWLGLSPRLRIRPSRWLILGVVGVVGLGVLASNSAIQERIFSVYNQIVTPGQTNIGFRFHLWQTALAMWGQAPWLGVGPDNYRLLLPEIATPAAASYLRLELGRTFSPHHAFLQVLAETGLGGAVSFGLFNVTILWTARKQFRRSEGQSRIVAATLYLFALMATAAMLYGGYAFGDYTQVGRLYFILVGLILAQREWPREPVAAA
ncbi:MAG: O-antigen ligase family protein [Anaerolineales bacterium]|nr:O-antigen ligase family protein [Anaerolineales bacterium]